MQVLPYNEGNTLSIKYNINNKYNFYKIVEHCLSRGYLHTDLHVPSTIRNHGLVVTTGLWTVCVSRCFRASSWLGLGKYQN